jgi:hypothetical protein
MQKKIDTTFDFRSDTPPKKDPDTYSETLRRYHKLLWSKPLPNGARFKLEYYKSSPPYYLRHQSETGEFILSSDTVVPSFWKEDKISDVIQELPAEELEAFHTLGYTIGGMMIWPATQIDRKMTINPARGCHPRIKDRFDLTVECIRRYYNDPSNLLNEYNPLGKTLHRYADFFELFGDFRGFVDFFLLQDLVTEDYSAVNFHTTPFEKFETYPFPKSVEAYRAYKQKASDFIEARNERILASS